MSSQIDCPICMECIDMTKNCLTTECGHCFHTTCLLQNVAHNGFTCPYCRSLMVKIVVPEEDQEDQEEEEEEEQDEDQEEEEQDEDQEAHQEERREHEREVPDRELPTILQIRDTLPRWGITYNDLVSSLLSAHREYKTRETKTAYGKIYYVIRDIINDYNSPDFGYSPPP